MYLWVPAKLLSKLTLLLEVFLFPFALTSSVFMIFPKYVVAFPAVWAGKLTFILASNLYYTGDQLTSVWIFPEQELRTSLDC